VTQDYKTRDSKTERTENSMDSWITSTQNRLLPSLFLRLLRPDSSLLPGPSNLLSKRIIKRTMSSPRRTMGPPTYGSSLAASNAGSTRETLSGNECVTSPLESASTFAYRCPVLPLPPSLSCRCGIFSSSS